MKKLYLFLKIIYLLTSIPLLFLCLSKGVFLTVLESRNNFLMFLSTFIVTDIYVAFDVVKQFELMKYNAEDLEKRLSSVIFFIFALSVFYLFFNVIIPLSMVGNVILTLGIALFGTIFLGFYVGFLYKVTRDYKKKCFNPFTKRKQTNFIDIVVGDLNKLKTYQKILVLENTIMVINEAGVFEFVNLDKTGHLKGNIDDEFWYIDDKKIKNPFRLKDENCYLISNSNTFYQVNVRLIPKSSVRIFVERKLNNKRIYTKEQIDDVYKNFEVTYGNNQNEIH